MPHSPDAPWLQAEREAAKLSLSVLARAVGANVAQLAAIEAGKEPHRSPKAFASESAPSASRESSSLAKTEETRGRERLSKHPDLVAALALVETRNTGRRNGRG